MSFWDEWQQPQFVTFKDIGDSVAGTLKSLDVVDLPAMSGGTRTAPQLTLVDEDGAEWILTAGQVRLRSELSRVRPDIGDYLEVVYTGTAPSKTGNPTKLFHVTVTRGGRGSNGDDEPPF